MVLVVSWEEFGWVELRCWRRAFSPDHFNVKIKPYLFSSEPQRARYQSS